MNKAIEVIPRDSIEAFIRYSWPGNIRELENFIERSVILSQGAVLDAPLEQLVEAEGAEPEPVTLKDAARACPADASRDELGDRSRGNSARIAALDVFL